MDEGEQSRGYGPLEQSQTSWGGGLVVAAY